MAPLALWVTWVSTAGAAQEVTVYRDTYGVPHIYAETAAASAFGLGYAQAEDRIEDIYKNVRTAIGSMAEAFGPEHVEIDYVMRLVRNEALCREKWPEVPENLRILCEQFVAGIEAYCAEHPERVPEFALKLEPWYCAAVGRAMILRWPLDNMMEELGREQRDPKKASNCWAVAPSRSAEGCAILLTDPHLSWESLAVFYEARIFGGPLALSGFCVVGSPMIALGHNAHVGWACTTGGPDTADVYRLKLNPETWGFPTQYEYDGKWRYGKVRMIKISVKGEDKPRVIPAMDTHLGPLISEPDMENHVAYAGATPYLEDMGLMPQVFRMATARNAHEFREALDMNSFMEQNVMFADREGNIGYARVGRTPIRPEGYDWRRPVPGDTSATAWQGIHPVSDMVQIMNPEQGYMQNCNISPANMMVNSPLTADKYPSDIYNATWDRNNPRGRRTLQMLVEDDSISKEEAKAIVMDVYDILAKPWQKALKSAVNAAGEGALSNEDLATTVKDILAWDGEFTQDSTAATAVEQWRRNSRGQVDVEAIAQGEALSPEGQTALLDTLAKAVKDLKAAHGKLGATWGETHVVGRGGQFYPYDGADFGRGGALTETVRCVEASEDPSKPGRWLADSGTMAATLMFFHKEGIESYTCIPWGQNAQEASPHHMDQGRELFSKRKMKPTWFRKEDLLPNVASEQKLAVP